MANKIIKQNKHTVSDHFLSGWTLETLLFYFQGRSPAQGTQRNVQT